jgi:hypothetical protein
MFPHATKHSLGVRSSTKAVVLAAILVLVAFLALPQGPAFARSHTAEQAVQSSIPQMPPASVSVVGGVGVASYSNNLYVFVTGLSDHLWVDVWNRSSWQWADQGAPA